MNSHPHSLTRAVALFILVGGFLLSMQDRNPPKRETDTKSFSLDDFQPWATLLADDDAAKRAEAVAELDRLGAVKNPQLLVLAAQLRDADDARRFAAARQLAQIGPRALIARPALVKLACDEDSHASVRWEAIAALRSLGKEGVPGLITVVNTTDRGVQYKALEAITQLGPVAQAAEETLTKLKQHTDPVVREAAGKALEAVREEDHYKEPGAQRPEHTRSGLRSLCSRLFLGRGVLFLNVRHITHPSHSLPTRSSRF